MTEIRVAYIVESISELMRVVMSGMLGFLSRAPQRKVSSVFRLRVLLQDMVGAPELGK